MLTREQYWERVAQGICVKCRQPTDNGYAKCAICRDKHRRLAYDMITARKALHMCITCSAPTEGSHTRCERCLAKKRLDMKKRRWGR